MHPWGFNQVSPKVTNQNRWLIKYHYQILSIDAQYAIWLLEVTSWEALKNPNIIRDLLGSPNSPKNDGQRTAKTSWARLARTLPRAAGQYAVGVGPAANAGVAGMLSSKAYCGNAGHVVKWLKLTYAGHICENHWHLVRRGCNTWLDWNFTLVRTTVQDLRNASCHRLSCHPLVYPLVMPGGVWRQLMQWSTTTFKRHLHHLGLATARHHAESHWKRKWCLKKAFHISPGTSQWNLE